MVKPGKAMFNSKAEAAAWKRFDRCRTRKCSAHIKRKTRNSKKFDKEQDKACPQKNNNEFYACSTTFYEGSHHQKLAEAVSKCSNTKCSKEKKDLANARFRNFLGLKLTA